MLVATQFSRCRKIVQVDLLPVSMGNVVHMCFSLPVVYNAVPVVYYTKNTLA